MKTILKIISLLGLLLTILPSLFVLAGVFTLERHFWLMLIGMILWFATAPFWMKQTSLEDTD